VVSLHSHDRLGEMEHLRQVAGCVWRFCDVWYHAELDEVFSLIDCPCLERDRVEILSIEEYVYITTYTTLEAISVVVFHAVDLIARAIPMILFFV
jgi:hypothetical protein